MSNQVVVAGAHCTRIGQHGRITEERGEGVVVVKFADGSEEVYGRSALAAPDSSEAARAFARRRP